MPVDAGFAAQAEGIVNMLLSVVLTTAVAAAAAAPDKPNIIFFLTGVAVRRGRERVCMSMNETMCEIAWEFCN